MARAPTAGHIGCPPDQVIIEDFVAGLTSRTWKATCDGRVYYCSVQSGEAYSQTACSPASETDAHNKAVVPGCQHDQECKGERICVDGSCQSS